MRARAACQRMPAVPRLCTWLFAADTPDRLWVGDMTVLPTREGPLYFAALVDACSRRVIGWAMDDHQRLDLTECALEMALQQRRPKPGLLLHHDRGSQYTGVRYRAKVEAAKIRLGMSRQGLPYDNAMAESLTCAPLVEALGTGADSGQPLRGSHFLQEIDAKLPHMVSARDKATPADVVRVVRDVEDADKVHFVRFIPHARDGQRHVTEANLAKPRRLRGQAVHAWCLRNNVSTGWTDIPPNTPVPLARLQLTAAAKEEAPRERGFGCAIK